MKTYTLLGVKGATIHLFKTEYNNNLKPDIKVPANIINFSNIKLMKDIYEFKDIIKELNNPQFSAELNESLEAYRQKLYFVSAASLGSILEHLLFLSIEKNLDDKDINIHENSTAQEYISNLKRTPLNANKRDRSYLKNIFNFRNSVSHYNKGFFNKTMCDALLEGITYTFHRFYLNEQPLD